MNLAVTFPNAEARVVSFLTEAFARRGDTASVATRIPNPRRDRMVRVSRTGGVRTSVGVDAPQLLFECWDSTDYRASELARVTRALVGSMDEFGAEMGSVVNYPDDSGLPRYQFAAVFYTAGAPL